MKPSPAGKLGSPAADDGIDTRTGHLQAGLKVWVPNPYDEDKTASRYRNDWLPPKVCGRPLWVPGTIVRVDGPSKRLSVLGKPIDSEVEVATALSPPMTAKLASSKLLAVNNSSPMDVDDLVDLSNLNEAAVLSGIVTRFLGDAIYTKAGTLLLAVNPYRIILDRAGDSIYDPVYIQRYRDRVSPKILDGLPASKRSKLRLPPHVFEVADGAYAALKAELAPQSIVISGESGAGKTETTKMLLSYLANISTDASVAKTSKRRPRPSLAQRGKPRRGSLGGAHNPFVAEHLSRVEQQLLETNPVLEAFGNAKTVRNDNSSRFGKLLRVGFDDDGCIAGWSTSSYLLEKSRVTSQAGGERGFHVFYFLLAGADPKLRQQLRLLPPAEYKYLNGSIVPAAASGSGRRAPATLPTIAGVDDVDEFHNLRRKLAVLGFLPTQQDSVWRTVAAVLALGNVEFAGEDHGAITNKPLVGDIAHLLSVAAKDLEHALVTTTATDKREGTTHVKPLPVETCARGRDALAKMLYGRLFLYVIQEVNRLVMESSGKDAEALFDSPEALFIGLLDIFGFEVFENNSFEQLCINYANEKLQQFFTEHVFKLEMQTYTEEGIEFGHLTFKDNEGIIELIENKQTGLMVMLQEACIFPRANDRTFINKLNATHGRRNPNFGKPDKRTEHTHFTVIHSAAPVTYRVEGFIQKNKDRLSVDLDAVVRGSADPVVAALLTDAYSEAASQPGGVPAAGAGSSTRPGAAAASFNAPTAFLCSKFRDDMARLAATLRTTQPHFIRCIKPNNNKQPNFIDPTLVHHQLMYLGVLDSIRIRHSGFSYRTVYDDFYDRFIIVAQQGGRLVFPPRPGDDIKDLCRELLDQLRGHPIFDGLEFGHNVQFGRTKIFLRKQMIRNLEALREVRLAAMDRMACKAQALWRGHRVRRHLRDMHEGFLRVQAAWRGRMYRSLWLARIWSARVIQYTVRGWLKRQWYSRFQRAVLSVQRWSRRCARRRTWQQLRRGVRVLHSLARGYIVRVHVVQMLTAVTKLQAVARSFLARNRTFWSKVRAALLFQASWRGFKHRVDNEDMMHFLALRRMDRARGRAARRFQATWRGLLFWRRFRQIRDAATTLQRWVLLKLNRQRFLAQQWAVRKIQAVARGYSGREAVRSIRTVRTLAEELYRLTKVREREQLELAHLNADDRAVDRVNTLFHATSKRTPQPLFKLLDVDVIVDNSDVFPRGWTQLFAELEADLHSSGTRVHSVALGSTHTAVLSEEGRVYSWGWGDRGQVGHGDFSGERRPRLVEALLSDDHPGHTMASPTRGSPPTRSPPGRSPYTRASPAKSLRTMMRVKQLVAGDEHTVALTDRGTVYTWGCNRRGQLGHGNKASVATPRLVEAIKRKVGAVAAGRHHTVLLVAAGSVYTCGNGLALGCGVYVGTGDAATPQAVPALTKRRIRGIAAGGGFSMAITHDGDLYTWGSGRDGQLGHGDTRDRLVPCLVDALHSTSRHGRISMVSCGAGHAAALSSTGRVFTWGDNRYGQLGTHDTVPRLRPNHVAALKLRRVLQVACSSRSTHVITDYNEVVGFGCTTSVIGDAGVLARASVASGGVSSPSAVEEAAVYDTFAQTAVPLEVPLHTVAGRTPKRLTTAFSTTLSMSGLGFTQLPNPRKTATGRTPSGGFNSAGADVSKALAKRTRALATRPAVELGAAEAKEDDYLTPTRRSARTPRLSLSAQKALSQVPAHKLKTLTAENLRVLTREVEVAEGRGSIHAGAAGLTTFADGTDGASVASAATEPRPVEKELSPSYLLPTSASIARKAARGGLDGSPDSRAELASPSPASPSASPSPAGGAGTPASAAALAVASNPRVTRPVSSEAKQRRLAAAQERREEENQRREAWRADRERRGKGAAGPDVAGLFTPALLVATSNDDMEVSDVLAAYEGRHPGHPSSSKPWSFAAHQAAHEAPLPDPTTRGLTVRSMLSDGGGAAPAPASPAPSMLLASSALGVGVSPLQLERPHVEPPLPAGVPPPPPPTATTAASLSDDSSLEAVLASIKKRAAAQVAALWEQ